MVMYKILKSRRVLMKIIRKRAKTGFGRSKIADCVLNQYIGCLHGCRYCYVKSVCRSNYGEWGTWVVVRENIPELIRGKFVKGEVIMSSLSDPYQQIESKIKLTRRVLEYMNKNVKLRLLTKSDLVLRDLDVFKEFRDVHVGLTINSFNSKLRREIEIRAVDMERRFNALKVLNENRIKTFGFIAPVIPRLTDLEYVVRETRDFVDYYIVEVLNLRVSGDFVFWLSEKHPESYRILSNRDRFKSFVQDLKAQIERLNIKVLDLVV